MSLRKSTVTKKSATKMALSKSPIQTLFPPFTYLVHTNRLSIYYITGGFMNGATAA